MGNCVFCGRHTNSRHHSQAVCSRCICGIASKGPQKVMHKPGRQVSGDPSIRGTLRIIKNHKDKRDYRVKCTCGADFRHTKNPKVIAVRCPICHAYEHIERLIS